MKCVTAGHEIVALANLQPEQQKGWLTVLMVEWVEFTCKCQNCDDDALPDSQTFLYVLLSSALI